MEIKINGSKLKIVKLDYELGDSFVTIMKTSLKYQFILFTDPVRPELSPIHSKSTIGYKKIPIDSFTKKEYKNCWALEVAKGKGVSKFEGEEYDFYQRKIILSFIYETSLYYQDTTEILSLSLRDKNVIDKFYSSYGKSGIDNFKLFIKNIIVDSKYKPYIICKEEYFPLNYDRDRYSVQRLISDLIIDNAKILTDEYLVGKIEPISSRREDISNKLKVESSEWYEISGIVGNKTRANLSLRFIKEVLVEIPKNDVGVDPGIKKLKTSGSLCIVKDGVLWQKYLGVKISNKLAGKLKRLKVIEQDLLYPGEYLINLSKIPVISKSNIKKISSSYLSSLEVKYALSNIALEYLEFLSPEIPKKLSDSEKFLNDLGIKGDFYYPKKETVKEKNNYDTVELVSNISGIPVNYGDRLRNYTNIKSGIIKGAIGSFISNLGITKNNIEELKSFWKNEKQKLLVELRNRKFQIIMTKDTRFSDKGDPFIDTVTCKVEIPCTSTYGKSEIVNVNWKFKTKKIYV